jgi:hypothetical protein
MPSIVLTANTEPSGINSAAALSSAVLNEARRKLPDIPINLVMASPGRVSESDKADPSYLV